MKIIDHCYQNRVPCAACLSLCAAVPLILCWFWFVSTLCYFGSIDTGLITGCFTLWCHWFLSFCTFWFLSLFEEMFHRLGYPDVIAVYKDCAVKEFYLSFYWNFLYLPVVSVFPSFSVVFSVGLLILPYALWTGYFSLFSSNFCSTAVGRSMWHLSASLTRLSKTSLISWPTWSLSSSLNSVIGPVYTYSVLNNNSLLG